VKRTRVALVVALVVVLLAVAFALHYVRYGSLPLGKPAMLDDR